MTFPLSRRLAAIGWVCKVVVQPANLAFVPDFKESARPEQVLRCSEDNGPLCR